MPDRQSKTTRQSAVRGSIVSGYGKNVAGRIDAINIGRGPLPSGLDTGEPWIQFVPGGAISNVGQTIRKRPAAFQGQICGRPSRNCNGTFPLPRHAQMFRS